MYMTGNFAQHSVDGDVEILEKVRVALQRGQILQAYQPIVLARDPSIICFYEGLIRAIDHDGRVMAAAEFIDIVEPTRLGREIDCIALKSALTALQKNPTIRISINVSMRSIGYAQWERVLMSSIKNDPTVAERLIIELTESATVRNPRFMARALEELRKKGVCIAMDDFGKAHSTVTRLQSMPFDIVKLDGSFCNGVAKNADNRAIVMALISMAKHFDTIVVAERIEDRTDAAWLADAGVDCMQGYLFGRPRFDYLLEESALLEEGEEEGDDTVEIDREEV